MSLRHVRGYNERLAPLQLKVDISAEQMSRHSLSNESTQATQLTSTCQSKTPLYIEIDIADSVVAGS